MESNDIKDVSAFVHKVEELKKQDTMDLSSEEDLSIAIMNLVSMEEHFFFTASKTGDDKYLDLLHEIREMRKGLLKRIIKDYEGEEWCISKHLLAASMRLMEVGTKALTQGHKEDAKSFFKKSYDLYNLFWGINLKAIKVGEVKKIDDASLNKKDKQGGIMASLKGLVEKVVNCCRE